MADWSEKCLTCRKAGRIPKWGWSWACNERECKYEPEPLFQVTVTETKEDTDVH